MLIFGLILLVPMVLGAESELRISNYIIRIDDGALKSVQPTDESPSELSLSNLNIRSIEKNAFDGPVNLRSLDLSGNALASLPQLAFSKLANLEKLSLADNKLTSSNNAFVGLDALKTLDVSNNLFKFLNTGYFHGLSKECYIVLEGNPLAELDSDIFESSSRPSASHGSAVKSAKICIQGDSVEYLDFLKNDDSLENGCSEVKVDADGTLILRRMGIASFEHGWYRLGGGVGITEIDLSHNNIARLSSELLNDLPSDINVVRLNDNKIETVESGIVANKHVRSLDLSYNVISEIADDAFANTRFLFLNLDGNRLKNTNFLATLPSCLHSLDLNKNEISEITVGSFANLRRLNHLGLYGNAIAELRSGSLRNLGTLDYLNISSNGLSKIEPGAFGDLIFLEELHLSDNEISELEKGVFAGLGRIRLLDIGGNKLTKITRECLADLPNTLMDLQLHDNEIESLEAGTFVYVPRAYLSLEGNKISRIEPGSFDLPSLIDLTLKNNSLSEFDAEAWRGLPSLRRFSLESNRIMSVASGAAKYLDRLETLELANNPIAKLDNGALHGLRKTGTIITVKNVPIKAIQAGLFDEM